MTTTERARVSPEVEKVSKSAPAADYCKPELVQVGALQNIRFKTGNLGDHDHDYYYS
jgi:hypothetical protein